MSWDLAAGYLSEMAPAWAPSTFRQRLDCLRFFRPYLERGLDRGSILAFVEDVEARPWSWRYRSNVLAAARTLLRWAGRQGHLSEELGGLIRVPRGRVLPRDLAEQDVQRLLERGSPRPRDRAILELLYGTGLRRAELCRLALDDIDLSGGTVHVRRGKGGKDRIVPFGVKAAEAVRRYLREERTGLRGTALFVTNEGEPLGLGTLWKVVATASRRAGLAKAASPHRLRHSYATHLLRGGADVVSIKALLGHAGLESTQVYTHLAVADLAAMIRRCHPRERGRREAVRSAHHHGAGFRGAGTDGVGAGPRGPRRRPGLAAAIA